MLRPGSSTRSEGLTAPQTQGAVLSFEEERRAPEESATACTCLSVSCCQEP